MLTRENFNQFFQNLNVMSGLDVMLGRVKYYRSVEFEDLEKLVLMNEGIPKPLEKGLFRWENDSHSFQMRERI